METDGFFMTSMEQSEDEAFASLSSMSISSHSEARILRSQIVQRVQRLEATRAPVLLALDDLDPIMASAEGAEELRHPRKVLTELLLRTERLEIFLGAREAPFRALGAHKVVAYSLEPLKASEAARLFLWRVHRPLVMSDFSQAMSGGEQGPPSLLPLIMTAQNRGMVLQQLASHPVLSLCGGLPGRLRAAADYVLPRNGTLFDIHQRLLSTAGEDIHQQLLSRAGEDLIEQKGSATTIALVSSCCATERSGFEPVGL
ncbi:unnamed protein product [Symbiodinium natans]|uniref:Uncharacterized protein n=1 Tax=Symbiodinium natans TaxID=878477 RepID=A0A812KLE9_9DINO|nr:unnamed protein product [Symbiodinium natans]